MTLELRGVRHVESPRWAWRHHATACATLANHATSSAVVMPAPASAPGTLLWITWGAVIAIATVGQAGPGLFVELDAALAMVKPGQLSMLMVVAGRMPLEPALLCG